jgi:hypothetical protein
MACLANKSASVYSQEVKIETQLWVRLDLVLHRVVCNFVGIHTR